jgi:replicative DNA helicase
VTSQLSRDAEYRDPKTGKFPLPSLRHLKWCGAIEEEASQVILLSRPSENLAEAEEEEIVFNVLKNRRGRTAFLTVRFQKLFNRFNGG